MHKINWLNPISGSFTNAADWSGGIVPGASDDAILGAVGNSPYTVNASGVITVDSLQTVVDATLEIASGTFTTLMGTGSGANEGFIDVDTGATLASGGVFTNGGEVYVANRATFNASGTLKNSGIFDFAKHSTFDFDEGLTITGGGTIDAYYYRFKMHGSTLVNVNNTLVLSGELGGEGFSLTNEKAGSIKTAVLLTINARNGSINNMGLMEGNAFGGLSIIGDIENSGVLKVSEGGDLEVTGKVTGSGTAVDVGGLMRFDSYFNQTISLSGTGSEEGEVWLFQSQTYTSAITGFSTEGRTTLDLADIEFIDASEATYSGTNASGVLTVTDGTHTANIHLIGDYLGVTFIASSGANGTDIIAQSTNNPQTPAHVFISAMAGFAANGGEGVHARVAESPSEFLLTSPRVAIA